MWNSTKITQLLGIPYPILQGPMGAGFSTAALLAAVSNAGGLGSYGAYTLTPEEILEAGKAIKELTNKPYNINLWVNDVDKTLVNYPPEKLEKIKLLFKPYFDELGIPLPDLSADIPSKFEKQVDTLFEIKPAVFSFIFGIPSKEILNESRRLGIKTIGAATTLEEALALEEAQVDAIVASGFEAGGHRPSFLRPAQDSFTGLFTLLQQLKAKTKTPIIAAGGIIDAKGIAAAMTLGADAVQLGTAFMVTEESGATPLHKQVLLSGTANPTTVSKSLTGRMGRLLSNRISDAVPFETEVLPFPLQTKLIAPLKAAALSQGKTEMISFWSGQNTSGLKHYSADGLMKALITETGALL
ncbi:nitronate monooxygenase [Flavobacterium circumlabens]|uniref:Nitronate monooxygenase n=1 Tax=Flavobacterium circumlabens TaxID=2133765 RepID=A0A4Y7UAP2_9FLAO|nr:nitronate monooxygenase [Flavobacterium circumlabens]TCN54660.1 nitronate monooxygenase [Flavobacterium circumlabens]TEB42852.1 nitronate monooxygenase [Flavobacterium circumlabens]